jgi:hypothetical protein
VIVTPARPAGARGVRVVQTACCAHDGNGVGGTRIKNAKRPGDRERACHVHPAAMVLEEVSVPAPVFAGPAAAVFQAISQVTL